MFGIWLAVAEGTLLGFEAQRVIALRAMKIAAGGSSARSEVSQMVTEKVSAGAEALAILTRGGSGRRSHSSLPDARKGKCATAVEIGAGEPGLIPPWLSGTKFRANFWLSVSIRLKRMSLNNHEHRPCIRCAVGCEDEFTATALSDRPTALRSEAWHLAAEGRLSPHRQPGSLTACKERGCVSHVSSAGGLSHPARTLDVAPRAPPRNSRGPPALLKRERLLAFLTRLRLTTSALQRISLPSRFQRRLGQQHGRTHAIAGPHLDGTPSAMQLLPFGKGFRKAGEAVLLGVGDKRLLAFKPP